MEQRLIRGIRLTSGGRPRSGCKTAFILPIVPADIRIIARTVATGAERDLAVWARPTSGVNDYPGRPTLSPDGRQIVTVMVDDTGESRVVLISPVNGDARTLWGGPASMPEVLFWAPDQQSVFVRWRPAGGGEDAREVWRMPVAGGNAERVDWTLGHDNREFRLLPDGRRLVYVVNSASSQKEVRVHAGVLERVSR